MEVEFVLLQFIEAYEGNMERFAAAYAPVTEGLPLKQVVRACLQYFIEHPDVIYMA